MPAQIESYAGRKEAWHKLGTVFGRLLGTKEALEEANLANWNVRALPFSVLLEGGTDAGAIDGKRVMVRDNPFNGKPEALSVVGGRYRETQNEEVFDFADSLIDSGEAGWETVGSLYGGRVVFGCLDVGREIVLDPGGAGDKIKSMLAVSTSHDGSSPIRAWPTNTRIVCANTLQMALSQAENMWTMRHTKNLEGKLAEAREALIKTYRYLDEFEEEAKALYETSITNRKFNDIVSAAFPEPSEDASKAAVTRWENTMETVHSIYSSPTCENIKGTAWGAFNAMTEYIDWFRPVKGANDEESDSLTLEIAQAGFDKGIRDRKQDAFEMTKELAGVN